MSGKYEAYAEYRDSGVEWLELIPEHWETSFLGFECSVKARLGWKGLKAEEYVDEGYVFLATPNIKNIEIDFNNVNRITKERYEESPEIMLEEGDVLVTKDGSTTGTTNVVKYLPEAATVNSSIAVLRSNGNIGSAYLYYFFVSDYTQNIINRMRGGMGVPHLFQADLRKFNVLIPLVSEQNKIANFLDHETAKIDTLIEKQQQLIKLLKEKRQAVISHAVTKGLNPDVPMRDSGVEWLGDVPEHWEIGRLKNVLKIRNGRDYKDVEIESGGYPVYGSGGEFKRSSAYLFNGKSVLFGRKGTVDKPLVVTGKFWTVDTMFYSEIYDNAVAEYIYYQATKFPFDLLSTNTALPSMTQEDLLMLGFVIPPIEEQENIVEFINKKCIQFDYLIDKSETAIKLIQERRTTLISSAVTGKIDVRNWQAPSQTNQPESA